MVKSIGIVTILTGAALVVALGLSASSDVPGVPPMVLGASTAEAPIAPIVLSKNAMIIATSTALLRGTIAPNGSLTTYWFEYSADPKLGSVLIRMTPRIALATTTGEVAVAVPAVNLMSHTTYYYRLVAESVGGTTRGQPLSFLAQ